MENTLTTPDAVEMALMPVDSLNTGLELADAHVSMYMTFQIGNEIYGIELKYVQEIIQMQPITPIPEVEHFIKGLINLRGKIIPVIDVADRFGKDKFDYNDRTCIIVVEVRGAEVGLVIETIAEVVTIDDADILPPPTINHTKDNQARYIRGVGKTPEGVKLLLDPVKLLGEDALDYIDKQENEEEE